MKQWKEDELSRHRGVPDGRLRAESGNGSDNLYRAVFVCDECPEYVSGRVGCRHM